MSEPITAASVIAAAQKTKQAGETGLKVWNWWKRTRYPKTEKGSYGIVVAINAETHPISQQIDNDLIKTLKRLGSEYAEDVKLHVFKLPEHHSEKVDSNETARTAIHKCDAKLLLWGDAKNRNIDGKEHTILELNVLISHGLIISTLSDAIRDEVRELLPGRLHVAKDNNLIEMEWNAIGIQLASTYLVAVACFFSDERKASLMLFEKLKSELNNYDLRPLPEGLRSHIFLLKKKVDLSIIAIHLDLAEKAQSKWRKTRRNEDLEESYSYLMKADSLEPSLYKVAVLSAIYYFVVENNVNKAKKVLESWAHSLDASWAFSLAFLNAFEGNMGRASYYYKIAFRRTTHSVVMLEVEEFLEWILEIYPEKFQIHYSLGMMQFFERDEIESGRRHFEKFLANTPPGQFVAQVQESQKYLKPNYKKPRDLR